MEAWLGRTAEIRGAAASLRGGQRQGSKILPFRVLGIKWSDAKVPPPPPLFCPVANRVVTLAVGGGGGDWEQDRWPGSTRHFSASWLRSCIVI